MVVCLFTKLRTMYKFVAMLFMPTNGCNMVNYQMSTFIEIIGCLKRDVIEISKDIRIRGSVNI